MTELPEGGSSDEVVGWFVPSKRPKGPAPKNIDRLWMGVPLPIRKKDVELGPWYYTEPLGPRKETVHRGADIVMVSLKDAATSLKISGHPDAAAFWESRYKEMSPSRILEPVRFIFEKSRVEILEVDEVDPIIQKVFS